ncbi:MAG: ABC transporter permease [Planctomycetes bacterium]|nr:ABC transporter permease [Planctomycetota bacterium]
MGGLAGVYLLLIVGMIAAGISFTTVDHIRKALADPNVRYAIRLSLFSCTVTTILALWVAVPIGYLMSRHEFRGKAFIDAVLDIPVILPPLVIGLCLLILFQTEIGRSLERGYVNAATPFYSLLSLILGRQIALPKGITYEIPSVILAQFMVACAFAVRTMRVAFDQIPRRYEDVALTLGCNRSQAFWRVVFPQAQRGMVAAGTLAWARSLGEFGPILVFAGATRMKTEVLSTTVFLELNVGNIEGAVAVSLIMIFAAFTVLIIARVLGLKRMSF